MLGHKKCLTNHAGVTVTITDSLEGKSVLSKIGVYIKSSEVHRHIGYNKKWWKKSIETETFIFVNSALININWHYNGILCSKGKIFSS